MAGRAATRHCIDVCSQLEVRGWSTAPSLIVLVNDGPVATIKPDIPRPDLPAAGIMGGHGFTCHLPRPLWLDDVVAVRGPDGSTLGARLDEAVVGRIAELLSYIDPAKTRGLEVGVLDRPLIPKARFPVAYLDQASRADLIPRYTGHGVIEAALVEPDFVVGGGTYAAATGGRRFGYAVASHVVEHVPDMVGWLWELWSVLDDGAVLALAVPHAERIFDSRRRLSSMAELADAYFSRLVRPSPRQIIDAMIGSALHHGTDVREQTFHAFHKANHARKTGLYVDQHCNTFTPASFAGLIDDLDHCGLLGFELLRLGATPLDDEFTVHLRKRADKVLRDDLRP